MSSITSEFNDRTRRAYLSMAAFNADIFTYTTALNSTTYVVEGTLSAVSGATARRAASSMRMVASCSLVPILA